MFQNCKKIILSPTPFLTRVPEDQESVVVGEEAVEEDDKEQKQIQVDGWMDISIGKDGDVWDSPTFRFKRPISFFYNTLPKIKDPNGQEDVGEEQPTGTAVDMDVNLKMVSLITIETLLKSLKS